MYKLIFKCVSMVIVFFGISQYMVYMMTGKSPLAGLEFPSFSLSQTVESITSGTSDLNPISEDTVYKWVDENGVTQYSSEKPEHLDEVSTIELDQNTNVIQGIEMPEIEKDNKDKVDPPQQLALPDSNIYSPESVQKVMGDARNVQKLLKDRYENQQKALDGL